MGARFEFKYLAKNAKIAGQATVMNVGYCAASANKCHCLRQGVA